ALDLALRNKFSDVTLDDFMRQMWRAHGAQEGFNPARPYTLADVKRALLAVTHDAKFTNEFFDRYIDGNAPPDFIWLLAKAGILVKPVQQARAWFGDVPLRFDSSGTVIAAPTLIGTPLYTAGLDQGDRIIAIDGHEIHGQSDLDAVLAAHHPRENVPIRFVGRDGIKDAQLAFGESPSLEVVAYEDAGRPVTAAIREFREKWLKGRGE